MNSIKTTFMRNKTTNLRQMTTFIRNKTTKFFKARKNPNLSHFIPTSHPL